MAGIICIFSTMRNLLLLFSFLCTFKSLKAQTKCDSLLGEWFFTKVETDEFYFDIADHSQTFQHGFNNYKLMKHVDIIPATDSMKIIKKLEDRISEITKNGYMRVELNNDHTYSWHGALYVPDDHKTGAFKCTGDSLSFSDDKKGRDIFEPAYTYKITYFDGKLLSLMRVECTLNYTILTFKRK